MSPKTLELISEILSILALLAAMALPAFYLALETLLYAVEKQHEQSRDLDEKTKEEDNEPTIYQR